MNNDTNMKVTVKEGNLGDSQTDAVVIGYFEDHGELAGSFAKLNNIVDGELKGMLDEDPKSGKLGSVTQFRRVGNVKPARIFVCGLGKKKKFSPEVVRRAVGSAVKVARSANVQSIGFEVHNGVLPASEVAGAVIEGASLALYKFDKWKKVEDDKPVEVEELVVMINDASMVDDIRKVVMLGEVNALATIHARNLVNEPSSSMKPNDLRDDAMHIADSSNLITLEVFEKSEIAKRNMNAFLAVAQGSSEDPYFLHLTYTPEGGSDKSVALVGKGITFDSGGLSIKPANAMEAMKMDMGGAATVLGVFSQIAELKPNIVVHGIIATCENMPGSSAYRPGDVIKASNGVSIEVLNTDAEGRVTLADSLHFASELKPNAIIDLATLTGACVVALGEEIVGLMTDNENLATELLDAGKQSGEAVWQLPLYESYDKLVKSEVADVKNIGGSWGGALTAGLFLKRFVDPDIPWAHLDIAGPAFAERDYLSYIPQGGTGTSVRLLMSWLKNR